MGIWRRRPWRAVIEAEGQSWAELQGGTKVKLNTSGGGGNVGEDPSFWMAPPLLVVN